MYALVYVDDILLTGSSSSLLHTLINMLNDKFARKKLRIPQYFICIEAQYQTNGSILLTKEKYIRDFLDKVNMIEANGISTPIFNTYKLSKH